MIEQTIRLFAASLLLSGGAAFSQTPATTGNPWQDSFALETVGNYAGALGALEPVLRANAGHEFALMRRGWLNYLQGRHNDAVRDYNQALNVNPRSIEARLGLALPLMAQQRWREAGIELRKVLAVSPWDLTANTRLLICDEGERRWEDMAKRANELAARFPSDPTVFVYLARAEAWLGNKARAKAAYTHVLERIPAHIEATNYLKSN